MGRSPDGQTGQTDLYTYQDAILHLKGVNAKGFRRLSLTNATRITEELKEHFSQEIEERKNKETRELTDPDEDEAETDEEITWDNIVLPF